MVIMKMQLFFVAVIGFIMLEACGEKNSVKTTIRKMRESELTIPNDLQRIVGRSISTIEEERKKATLVIYYDSLECSSCRVDKLYQLDTIFGLEKTYLDYEVLVVFSPSPCEVEDVKVMLFKRNYKYPVYLDYSGKFRELNDFIPIDNRFHTFLVGQDLRPLFIGDPYVSKNMWDLFILSLDNLVER